MAEEFEQAFSNSRNTPGLTGIGLTAVEFLFPFKRNPYHAAKFRPVSKIFAI